MENRRWPKWRYIFFAGRLGEGKRVLNPKTSLAIEEGADAELVHEAAIGKIAGDQLRRLISLGLAEEAEEAIISGFLK